MKILYKWPTVLPTDGGIYDSVMSLKADRFISGHVYVIAVDRIAPDDAESPMPPEYIRRFHEMADDLLKSVEKA